MRYIPSPLSLAILAALTPEIHSVKIIDERFENINFNRFYDLVGISCCTFNATRSYQIADEFRKRGTTVVLGGAHASALPEEAKQHADSVVIGEAEETWPQLLKDFEKGKLKPFYRQTRPVNPDTIPKPKRDILYKNSKIVPVQATRGCPYSCEFCSVGTSPLSGVFRCRPIESVIEEISEIKEKNIVFHDASLTILPNYTKQLFKEMKNLNKRFICEGNINVLSRDKELIKLAGEAGCLEWEVGFESISQATIDQIGKKTNRVEKYADTIKNIRDNGMEVLGSFIFGFDTDTKETFNQTINEIYRMRLNKASFNILTPFPGTPLFERLEREGRILTRDWSKYNAKEVVFYPKNMSINELLTGYIKTTREFHSFRETFRRFIICDGAKNMHISPLTILSGGFFS
ncbi:MAG: B12-binding domain-containing radical SAM protein [Thermoplasmata archaeon]|nr:B12-binding domain-containing radical SAM protein [Thermoplasmata archaeon]